MCFWAAGCAAPRVEGFKASIKVRADAQPRVIHQFPLSAIDQLRLEYHEDMEVLEGQAEWLPLGTPCAWASPSFVVDSGKGKGLPGLPVPDCRWVNHNTSDSGWPSPNAEAVLARAQRGWFHTAFDCVWGVTQLDIDDQHVDLLTLITRRSMLRFVRPHGLLDKLEGCLHI